VKSAVSVLDTDCEDTNEEPLGSASSPSTTRTVAMICLGGLAIDSNIHVDKIGHNRVEG
jgi:hypothetical protein